MNVLILDIDGVMIPSLQLNPPKVETSFGLYDKFDDNCINTLNALHEHYFPFKIVLSSDWTVNNITSISQMEEYFKAQFIKPEIIGFTTKLNTRVTADKLEEARAEEISNWINVHKPKKWVAIDDYDLSSFLSPNFVRAVDDQLGISDYNTMKEIIKKFAEQ